jgi:hypothetical protein
VFIPKRENETVEEWGGRVRAMAPFAGYTSTPKLWIELVSDEEKDSDVEREFFHGRGDAGSLLPCLAGYASHVTLGNGVRGECSQEQSRSSPSSRAMVRVPQQLFQAARCKSPYRTGPLPRSRLCLGYPKLHRS